MTHQMETVYQDDEVVSDISAVVKHTYTISTKAPGEWVVKPQD